MSEVRFDPLMKTRIRNRLIDFVFGKIKKDLESNLSLLIARNSQLHGNAQAAFRYKRRVFTLADESQLPYGINPLHEKLEREGEELIKQLDQLLRVEIPQIDSFFTQALNASDNIPDYLKIFPESIHKPLIKIISDCPCNTTKLSEDQIEKLISDNAERIQLLKQRLLLTVLTN